MGCWGFKLYQNDTSLDVKDEFERLLDSGKSVREITDEILEEYGPLMGDEDEEPLFWFALADTQWNQGVLLPDIKEKALLWVEKVNTLLNGQDIDMAERDAIKETVDKLRIKLLSPQPPEKKRIKRKIYRCQWHIGDVFAYQLESDLAKERGLYGRYFLIQKVDEGVWYPGHIVPIVYVKITKDSKLPADVEEYNELEFVQTWFTKYEDRFLPINMRCPEEDFARKSKIDYQVDEYGYLPQYRATLLNTSKRVIPSKLIYVGNFANAERPQREFIPHENLNIISVAWKQFDETFEIKMIKQYCGHNLRELSIYAETTM